MGKQPCNEPCVKFGLRFAALGCGKVSAADYGPKLHGAAGRTIRPLADLGIKTGNRQIQIQRLVGAGLTSLAEVVLGPLSYGRQGSRIWCASKVTTVIIND